MELRGLNDRQREAVLATEGRVRIIAGAGSGKTRVLAYRYAYLVDELGIDPGNILCLTFTNKAAAEMRMRINRLIGGEYASDFICTIHSFCVKFLREEIFRIGYPKTFQILDEEDMKAIAKEAHEENGLERKESTVERFLKTFYKTKAITGEEYIKAFLLPSGPQMFTQETSEMLTKNYGENHLRLFQSTILRERKYLSLDFDDLIFLTIYILDNFDEVRKKWQKKINYIMVDEVQDCNLLDWKIYETLSAMHGNLFLVGDPDQTIYEWRGADLPQFLNCSPQTDIVMAQNYRSTATILEAANSIIRHNDERIKKDLFTCSGSGEKITHFHGKDDKQEADWISAQILKNTEAGSTLSDCAVLVRSAYLTRSIEQSFMKHKISYVIWGGVRFFERKEIKDSLCYLRLVGADDDLAFKRIANVPSRKIGKKAMEDINAVAQERRCSLFEALRELSHTKAYAKDSVLKFIELIDSARDLCAGGMTISNLLECLLAGSGLNELYRNDEEEERLENLNELVQSIKNYESDHKEDDITLQTYLQDIALYTNADYMKDKNFVRVMTIHQAKGLEFPYVFVAGLNEGVLPNKRSVRERKKKAMEEERRLMYVAVTRAQKKLCLTESEGYSVQGGFDKLPSRFIREIKEGLYVTEGRMDESLWDKACSFSRSMDAECGLALQPHKDGLAEGDSVMHKIFGKGIVRSVYDNGDYCEVEFLGTGLPGQGGKGLRSLKADKLTKS